MPPAPSQTSETRETWLDRLYDEFGQGASAAPLGLAEQALRDHPTDPQLLHLAALAALVAERPDRCLRYLKRLGKRYLPEPEDHLLRALTLASQGRQTQAKQVLKTHGLTTHEAAFGAFRGGPGLAHWMFYLWSRAMAPARQLPKKTPPVAKQRKRQESAGKQPSVAGVPPPTPEVAAPELPRIAPRIPVQFEWLNREAVEFAAPDGGENDPGRFQLRDDLARLSLLQGFDELLCLSQLDGVQTYWYQVETVRKVLKQFRGRVLLADEVGLGKTIEAGMVLKEYLLRGMVERFLILTPASLVGQWREELATKFGLACATTHQSLLRSDPKTFWAQPRVIASIATARRKEHFAHLTRSSYDLIIVDEAHHLKNRTTRNYKLVDSLQKRFLLLLSATPVQNSLVELYNLLTLLKPGIFKTEKEFRAVYMTPGKPRLPANHERMRNLMRDVMVRNTRALVDVRLPARHASTLRVAAEGEELDCYQQLSGRVRELHQATGGGQRLALRHLLTAAGSSPAAAAGAIERFGQRHPESTEWTPLANRYRAMIPGAKTHALLHLLQRNPEEKKMVFTHHRDTLAHLAEQLTAAGIDHVVFEGGLGGPAKDEVIARFRDRAPVLLCTESGGEGRNLQFCNTLINFDLPWNPMAIEQRIGRIHRIGQAREVFVFNLVLPGTLEDEMLKILDEKINMFELVVGEVGAILGEIGEEQDFSQLVFDAWVQASSGEEEDAFDQLGETVIQAKRRYEAVKELDDDLFGDEFETT